MPGRFDSIKPAPGQESVWSYPRPPRLESVKDILRVDFAGECIARTSAGFRVLETSHPPVYYFPPSDVHMDFLCPAEGHSFCEFKGVASYWTVVAGGARSRQAAWSYPDPAPAFSAIKDYLAFYASRVSECWVGDERATAQTGDFYGGWITRRVVGPFKGGPETLGW